MKAVGSILKTRSTSTE
ncbi:hypothetical protein Avbf_15159 [Armadillidium vulgare]|nr:hypothetical protein Avbf_15159 [Armadillidium vulgare]